MKRHAQSPAGFLLPKFLKYFCGLISVAGWLLSTGCSTTEMKGTPFYTGESSQRRGAAEQRVNVWPLFYYREPDLSVTWPVFELTEDHAAVRPLFSVYGLNQTNQEYNVLWPFAQWDQRTGDNRIVPLFWGDDYLVLFPLYWHYGQPWGARGGSDVLFPLWMLNRKGADHFNLHSPWPLVHVWADPKAKVNGSMVVPLYWHQRAEFGSRFYSPLWLSESNRDGDYWRMLLPLFYQMADGDDSAFVSPVWAQGHSGEDDWRAMFPLWYYRGDGDSRFDLSSPWPLVRFWSDGKDGDHGSRVLPLYWHNHEAGASQFFSLPWSCGSEPGGSWRCLPPVYYQASNARRSTLLTPLWSQGRNDQTDWELLMPLWFRSHEDTNRFNFYSPLAHFWSDRGAEDHGSAVFPLYWQRHQRRSSEFVSLLWLSHTDPNGDNWRLLPPLYYSESNRAGSKFVTPFWAQGKTETNDWTAVVPFCYWDRQQKTLLSPLWAHWRQEDTETWLAPWTLSWQTRRPERSDLTMLGGLAHASWGMKPGPDYVFPLFYNDPATRTLLSPVYLRWREGDTETSLAPWLLALKATRPERSDLWLAGGLARASWGEKPGADYAFPLFYHEASRLLTPVFGWDDDAGLRYFATPLAGLRTGTHAGSWLFPLYSHARVKASGEVKDNFALLGGHTKTKQGSRAWLIPLFYYRNQPLPAAPLEAGKRYRTFGKNFWCLPFCWYENRNYLRPPQKRDSESRGAESESDSPAEVGPATANAATNAPMVRDDTCAHGVFPLWSYSAQSTPAEQRSKREFSALLWLYDYKHEQGPPPGTSVGATNDYTRSRVLWRLWHSEKLNGNASVDVFPAFTYDRKTDGFKKISFLWRLFRYERAASGEHKLDVLFVPLQR